MKRAAEKLKARACSIAAYETEDELERKRKIAQARGRPPIYDRAALKLSDRRARGAGGARAASRIGASSCRARARNGTIWCAGRNRSTRPRSSDPVLIREDGAFLYTLPSVVDDVDFNITHIVRGEDHVTNTGVQIEIFEALGAARRRCSGISRCWSAPTARRCRSGWARCR